jgi:hypothetical protein
MYTGNAYSHNLPWKGYTRMMFMVSVKAQHTLPWWLIRLQVASRDAAACLP